MTIEAIIALALTVFIFSLKPGPGIITSMSYSLSHGWAGLLAFLVGFNIGLGVFLSVVFFGLMGISQINIDLIFVGILAKSLAALILIAIGVKELLNRNEKIKQEMVLEADKAKTFIDIATSAMLLTLSNPMVIVFYASLIPAFIAPEEINLYVATFVIALLMVIDSFGMILYAAPLIIFRKTLPLNMMKYVKTVSALVIIGIGLYIGYTAIFAKDILSVS